VYSGDERLCGFSAMEGRECMGRKQKQPVPLSGLLQYIAQTQQSFARTVANASTAEERKDEQLTCNISLWEVDSAQKYLLKPSALAMIMRLMPEHSQAMLTSLPGTGIWMMLDDPTSTNVYFSSMPHATFSYLESHPRARMPRRLVGIADRPWLWDFEVMAIGHHPLSYLYDADRQRWTLNNIDVCPVRRCEQLGMDQWRWPNWYICDVCRPAFEYWTSWLPVALMAVNLDFAETEERPKRATFIERETRKKRAEKGYQEVSVTHMYQIVTFDISVKTQIPPIQHPSSNELVHPTWLEQAIHDETVLYVDKHIEQTQRTFKHERYINMRGKTIDVRPYDKRIPMSVKRLKHTIYQAVASGAKR
jgi:hypothetical protein